MSEAKEYLQKIKLYDARIENGLQELSALEDMVLRITPVLKQDMVSGSHSQDKLGDTVAKIADLRNQINRDVDAFIVLKKEAAAKLAHIEKPEHCKLLYMRYFSYYTFEKIATEMNYSYRNITKMHGRALQAFEKVMEKEKEA